jgi:hypothetical protein
MNKRRGRRLLGAWRRRQLLKRLAIIQSGDLLYEISGAQVALAWRQYKLGRLRGDEKGLFARASTIWSADNSPFDEINMKLTIRVRNDPEEITWFKLAVGGTLKKP